MAVDNTKRFQMIAGDVALDLVNTVDFRFRESGSVDLLEDYRDLPAFLTQAGLLRDAEARRLNRTKGGAAKQVSVLAQVKNLRETLSSIFYDRLDGRESSTGTIRALEEYIKQANSHRTLVSRGDRLVWSWGRVIDDPTVPLWLLAQAAGDLLLSDRVEQVRNCACDTCRWLFLDTSKNHMRRWCDMKLCGNRMKAKRFQARRGARETP